MSSNIIDIKNPQPNRVVIAVDYSNVLYRAYFSCSNDLEIRPWLPFIRFLDMLRTCVKYVRQRYDICSIEFIFAGDSVRTKLDRMKVDESYKADRPPLANLKFYIFRHVMDYVLEDMGCNVVYSDGSEGDDIIATVVAQLCKKCGCAKCCANCTCQSSTRLVIFSMDRDLNSLLEYNNTVIYRPPSIFYSRDMFELEYGFHPRYFQIFKALVGDKSDGIKPVPLWGENRAKIHILKGDWEEVLIKDDHMEKFQHNLDLVRFNYDVSLVIDDVTRYIGVLSSDKLKEKVLKEYYRQDAVDDIDFAEKRLEEACNNF